MARTAHVHHPLDVPYVDVTDANGWQFRISSAPFATGHLDIRVMGSYYRPFDVNVSATLTDDGRLAAVTVNGAPERAHDRIAAATEAVLRQVLSDDEHAATLRRAREFAAANRASLRLYAVEQLREQIAQAQAQIANLEADMAALGYDEDRVRYAFAF